LSFNRRASRWWPIQFLLTGIMVEKHQWRWANPTGLKKQRTKPPLGFIVSHFEDATGLILKGQLPSYDPRTCAPSSELWLDTPPLGFFGWKTEKKSSALASASLASYLACSVLGSPADQTSPGPNRSFEDRDSTSSPGQWVSEDFSSKALGRSASKVVR
jgi:hypothetical protein